jgi:hypothetical protein
VPGVLVVGASRDRRDSIVPRGRPAATEMSAVVVACVQAG